MHRITLLFTFAMLPLCAPFGAKAATTTGFQGSSVAYVSCVTLGLPAGFCWKLSMDPPFITEGIVDFTFPDDAKFERLEYRFGFEEASPFTLIDIPGEMRLEDIHFQEEFLSVGPVPVGTSFILDVILRDTTETPNTTRTFEFLLDEPNDFLLFDDGTRVFRDTPGYVQGSGVLMHTTPIPEPSSFLFVLGTIGVVAVGRNAKRLKRLFQLRE